MKKILKVLGLLFIVVLLGITALLIYVKTALPDVGPPPDLVVEKSPERIAHGAYLANHVTVCIDCHSQRNMGLWSGPLVAGTNGKGGESFTKDFGFPGNFYAPNITPYGIGSWTDGELFRAITTGVNKNGKALFNIMPYQYYATMDTEDIKDIIAYIRTLPAIKNDVPASHADFPVNFILNTIPQKAVPGKKPDQKDVLAYGGYLTNAAACVECHSKRENGKLVGELFAGGFEFKMPGVILRSPNITSDKETGIGNWSEAAFVNRFKSHADSAYKPPVITPGQPQTIMPWTMYGGMDTADLKAIYAYLKSVKPVANKIVRFEPLEGK